MDRTIEDQGPNLVEDGILAADLKDGGIVLGHTNEESVLLVRRGAQVYAVGAYCTHYGTALRGGTIEGETIHCPRHHATFNLRTGAATAPAFEPLACWAVEQRGERLYVSARSISRPIARKKAVSHVLVVGGGAAGHAALETLRAEGFTGKLTMITGDGAEPYDRPNLSKDYLAGTAPEDWLPLRPSTFYRDHDIEVITRTRVDRIDVDRRSVVLPDGSSRSFDVLILATGSEPLRLAVPGSDLPHVRYLRTADDCREILARLPTVRNAVVVGSSFIGLEVAASLREREVNVHLVSRDLRPLERTLGPQVGDFVRALHEAHGVTFHMNRSVASIAPKSLILNTGDEIDAELLVVGIGVKPATELAEKAGLAIDRGVLVDEYMETSVPGIYAVGDIARWPDRERGTTMRVEHWVVAERHGEIAARSIMGQKVSHPLVPFFWSQHYDVSIAYVGYAEKWDHIDIEGSFDRRNCVVAYRLGDRTLAVATVGRDKQSIAAELAFEHNDRAALSAIAHSAHP